jgi:hypothetical protein
VRFVQEKSVPPMRAARALEGVVGKRLAYAGLRDSGRPRRRRGRRRNQPVEEPWFFGWISNRKSNKFGV